MRKRFKINFFATEVILGFSVGLALGMLIGVTLVFMAEPW